MNVLAHSLTAVPFVLIGNWPAAAGCIAADITWSHNEIRYRRSRVRPWKRWSLTNLGGWHQVPYRLAHSLLIVPPICAINGWWWFLMGWFIHVACDLPTHDGVMRQQPLYPFKWRWPWVWRRFC